MAQMEEMQAEQDAAKEAELKKKRELEKLQKKQERQRKAATRHQGAQIAGGGMGTQHRTSTEGTQAPGFRGSANGNGQTYPLYGGLPTDFAPHPLWYPPKPLPDETE